MKHRFLYLFFIGFFLLLFSCKHKRNYNGELITDNPCKPGTVYFQNTILPLLSSRCGVPGCHDAFTHAEGIDVSSYTTIMNSSEGNFVVYGHPDQSSLYTSIVDGSMPPSIVPSLTQQQTQLIYDWIDQGAFNNYCADCDTTKFLFSADIFPIFQNKCTGCHGSVSPGGGIPLTSYTEIVAQVGNFEIQGVLDGSSLPLMPPSVGLPACEKTQILKWISNGSQNN